jgi:hypothetical protein
MNYRPIGVWPRIRHAQAARLIVLQDKVLIVKRETVDGIDAGPLGYMLLVGILQCGTFWLDVVSQASQMTYIAPSEATTLEHKPGVDTVKRRARVAVAGLARGELAEVARDLGDDIIAQIASN